mmetsp:Transcript_61732/g.198974  ORF Transcript_61732/g.198974 Transcript_61732/m.198974 type:complete len:259 (-) Transcript_61732:387-1163(-)
MSLGVIFCTSMPLPKHRAVVVSVTKRLSMPPPPAALLGLPPLRRSKWPKRCLASKPPLPPNAAERPPHAAAPPKATALPAKAAAPPRPRLSGAAAWPATPAGLDWCVPVWVRAAGENCRPGMSCADAARSKNIVVLLSRPCKPLPKEPPSVISSLCCAEAASMSAGPCSRAAAPGPDFAGPLGTECGARNLVSVSCTLNSWKITLSSIFCPFHITTGLHGRLPCTTARSWRCLRLFSRPWMCAGDTCPTLELSCSRNL